MNSEISNSILVRLQNLSVCFPSPLHSTILPGLHRSFEGYQEHPATGHLTEQNKLRQSEMPDTCTNTTGARTTVVCSSCICSNTPPLQGEASSRLALPAPSEGRRARAAAAAALLGLTPSHPPGLPWLRAYWLHVCLATPCAAYSWNTLSREPKGQGSPLHFQPNLTGSSSILLLEINYRFREKGPNPARVL